MTQADSSRTEDFLTLIRLLARETDFREQFKTDPARAVQSKDLNLSLPDDLASPGEALPARERFEDVLALLESERRFGFDSSDPASLFWICRFPR